MYIKIYTKITKNIWKRQQETNTSPGAKKEH